MVTVTICMGSACFVKGSKKVADTLMHLIDKHDVKSKVDLRGAFCMGRCKDGVNVEVNGEVFSVSPDTAASFFFEKILPETKD